MPKIEKLKDSKKRIIAKLNNIIAKRPKKYYIVIGTGAYPEIFRGGGPDFFSHTFSIFGRGPKNFSYTNFNLEGGPHRTPLVTPM